MIPDNLRQWYYFGCRNGSGHHLIDKTGSLVDVHELESLDGQLCLEREELYIALLTRLPDLGYSALAWWDKTVDTRPGSNSIIFCPSLTCPIASIYAGAERWFPWVLQRLPVQLTAVIPERIHHECHQFTVESCLS